MLKKLSSYLFGNSSLLGTGALGGKGSKGNAKSRLSFVLVQDRTGLNQQDLTKFKKEMVGVLQKYFDIQEKAIDINYKRDGDMTTLFINSPVVVRRPSAKESASAIAATV